jgi:hypothetical protein
MIEKQKLDRTGFLFFLSAFFIISLSFIFFVPKVSSRIIPFRQEATLQSFLQKTITSEKINGQEYWKFREFYSPGHFDFNEKGLDGKDVAITLKELGANSSDDRFFLKFNSSDLVSLDGVSQKDSIKQAIGDIKGNVLIDKDDLLIIEQGDAVLIAFILPYSEMIKANGFLDYNKKELDYLKETNWLNITRIRK